MSFRNTAIVHDWLLSPFAGAERCLRAIHELYQAPIYTLLRDKGGLKGSYFADLEVISSFIQKMPFAGRWYRNYLPLFPFAVEQFDLSSYDLILSSSHCVAKGVLSHAEQLHICYCHTPMRYAWDLTHEYLARMGIKKGIMRAFLHRLRGWDVQSAHRVDHFLANSKFVAKRIRKIYGRQAHVIYPPVDVEFFGLEERKEGYYIAASRFVSYKKMDLIIDAFSSMPKKRLVVVGEGPEEKRLKKMAGKNVEFLGFQEDRMLRGLLQRAKAFVFAAVEDFGILPVEAMACGTPVIGLKRGGLCETVLDGVSGLFFDEPDSSSICSAVERFENMDFEPRRVRERAEIFRKERFEREFFEFVESRYAEFRGCMSSF